MIPAKKDSFGWDQVLQVLAENPIENLSKLDANSVRTELSRLGLLEAVLNEKMDESYWLNLSDHQEEFHLFQASQIACQYLQRTILAARNREKVLRSVLQEIEDHVYEIHDLYDDVRNQRKTITEDMLQLDQEIASCDRLLKSSGTEEDENLAQSRLDLQLSR